MPKYVAYESEEDDEIEVIPFVKPAPPVIDLVEDEEEGEKQEPKKSSKEKKSKKKKKNRDAQSDSQELIDITENSLSGDIVTTAVNLETENSLQAKKVGRNVEPSAEVGAETSTSNLSSKNVASQNRASKTVSRPINSDIDGSQPMIAVAEPNSILESASNVEVESGDNVASTSQVGNANDTTSSASKNKKRSSSAEPKKRQRKMTQLSATRKAAAEISSFLNTLGIPIEVRDLTPVTRRRGAKSPRGPRKSLDMDAPPAADDSATTPDVVVPPIASSPLVDAASSARDKSEETTKQLNGFVQVTQEISSPRKRNSKKRKPVANEVETIVREIICSSPTPPTALITNFVFPDGHAWPPANEESSEINSESPSEPSRKKKKRKDRSSLDCSTENIDSVIEVVSRAMEEDTETYSGIIATTSEDTTTGQSSVMEVGNESTEKSKKRKKRRDSDKEVDGNDAPKEKLKNRENKSGRKTPEICDDDGNLPLSTVNDQSDLLSDRRDASPVKKKSKIGKINSIKSITAEFFKDLVDTQSSKKSTDEIDGSKLSKQKEKNERKEKNEKRKEKESREERDKQNMPPPPPPSSTTDNVNVNSRAVQRRSEEYYLTHSGFPTGWTDDMKAYYGTIHGQHYSLNDTYRKQTNNRQMWKAPMDMFRRNKRTHGPRCTICHQFDHVSRNCPDKHKPLCCSMCGGKGHTSDSGGRNRCPETCCLNCGLQREKFSSGCSQCLYRRQPLRCHLCGVSGHSQESCPDTWRRYHSITTPLPDGAEALLTSISVTQYKRSYELYCCNCAAAGHAYYDCTAPRYKNNPFHRNKPQIVREIDLNSIAAHFSRQTTSAPNNPQDIIIPGEQNQTSPNRTVVVNRDLNEQVVEQNEVIRIQIQNDPITIDLERQEDSLTGNEQLAIKSSISGKEIGLQCSEHPDCSNKIRNLHVCHHIAVNSYQQSLLLKAKDADAIRPIEESCKVNISILRQVLQVHISGENWKMAENELYEILFTRAKEEQVARDNARTTSVCSSEETTRRVLNDGENISVVISKPLFMNESFGPMMPSTLPLPLVPSMDVDERFASPQDLITNIPIIRADGPFAPGQYVPFSVLPPALVSPPSISMPIPSSPSLQVQNVTSRIDNAIKSMNTEKSSSNPISNKESSKKEMSVNVNKPVPIVETIEDSDDEIVILEEIKEPPKKILTVLTKTPVKSEEGLNVVLLPSEWDVVFADSIKRDGILQKIAKLFEVTIFVSKENNSCRISNGKSFDRQKAKEKVTLWLGCHAAKTTFVLNVPEEDSSKVTPTVDAKQKTISSSTPPPTRRLIPPASSKRRSSGSPRAKGSSHANSRRGASPVRRYNPAPNTNPPARSSAPHRGYGDKGPNHKSPRFSRPFRGMPINRPTAATTSNKPPTESSKRRFRYFN